MLVFTCYILVRFLSDRVMMKIGDENHQLSAERSFTALRTERLKSAQLINEIEYV